MGRAQREKGKRGERAAAKAVSDAFGCQARRGVQYKGGDGSADIDVSIPGVHWEVKFVEREQVRLWVEQASRDAGELLPVVLHRKSRKPWLVTMPLERLYEFCTRLAEAVAQEVQAMGDGAVSDSLSRSVLSQAASLASGYARQQDDGVL